MATNRRSVPTQERSRQMVERLVDATARVLARDGYPGASTNRIAQEAGVSPGSLYRYFADKDELLVAVTRRFVVRFGEALAPAMREAVLQDTSTATRTMIEAVLDALDAQADLLRALAERVPAVEQDAALRAIRARLADFVFQTLASRRGDLRHGDLARMTWNMVELAQHLPVRYVLDRPPIEREAFVTDTVRTLLAQAFVELPPESDAPATAG